ncbi:hypothetical protein MAE02_27820 [Microvirga aerophila]|uniref:Uncharacterized protein n=1 Tax=Microvirga aerophila TaxID=670291 RepID=A0A512BSW1_9HYPH|nr:hypothetical protein MAE02_27820 [Microvirga aerophila]
MVTDWCGVHTHLLFPNILVLLRSEKLLDAHGPLKSINDLAYHRQVYFTPRRYAGQNWLRAPRRKHRP